MPAPLRFGTAGLRGPLGDGPGQLNDAAVRRVAAAVASWQWNQAPSRSAGAPPVVVVGHDARHASARFADVVTDELLERGCDVARFPDVVPTPLVTFAVRDLAASGGVIVTASHNPAGDHGIKVVAADGAQVAARDEAAIEASMSSPDPTIRQRGRLTTVDRRGTLSSRYVARAEALAARTGPAPSVLYSALHGVGADLLEEVLAAVGIARVSAVEAQRDPDPDFPTAPRPNPEEPAALELLLAEAAASDATLAFALDPDADRLAVAVPAGPGAPWRVLTGDEVGALLAAFLLRRGSGSDRFVASTVVSSRLVGRICDHAGVRHVETPTGFKWLCRPGIEHPEWTQVLCYEEAMGYAVGADARDKDGITAAAVVCALASELAGGDRDLLAALDDLAVLHGVFVTRNASVGLQDDAGVTPSLVPPEAVRFDEPLPGTLRWWLPDDTRVAVRRSGTEPRLKYYCEAIRPVGRGGPAAARRDGEERLDAVESALVASLGGSAPGAPAPGAQTPE